jgi:hypothetical protein
MSAYVGPALIFLGLSGCAALAIHFYYVKRSHRKIPTVTHVFIVTSNFVCLLPFPLLILDVDSAISGATPSESKALFTPFWYAIMGITQVMAWVLLPIAQEYDQCGEFEIKRRLQRAIRENVKLYAIMGVVVGLLFGYIVFLKGLRTFGDILKLGVGAANAFGLLLIIIFLASGLVGLPKLLWKSSDPELELRRHFFDAPDIQEDLDIAAMELAEIKAELVAVDPRVSDEDRPYLTDMLERISEADRDVPLYHTRSSQITLLERAALQGDDVSTQHLEMLNTRLKRAIKVATRMNYLWESSIRQCKMLDRVIHGVEPPMVGGGAARDGGDDTGAAARRADTALRLWIRFRNPLYRLLAVASFFLTVLVLWSELILPFQSNSDQVLSVIEVVMQSKVHFLGSVTFLFYMVAASYWATFQFKVFEVYHVLPSVSDGASLCFTATFLTRLIMPLCYNFLMISGLVSSDQNVVYSEVFGSMDVGAILGQWFNQYLPAFIPLLAVLIQTKVFHRILILVGVDWHDPSDITSETVQQKIHDGRRLIMTAAGREMLTMGAHNSPTPTSSVSPAATAGSEMVKGQRYRDYLAKKAAATGPNSDSAA